MRRYNIRNMADLKQETAKLRRTIRSGEQILGDDARQVIDSITPMRIISGITSKLLASAPTIYTAFTIVRSIFGKKK